MNSVQMDMEIDSGASISAISHETFQQYFSNSILSPTELLLKSYNGSYIKPFGTCKLEIVFNNLCHFLDFYVIENGGPPILGRNWMEVFKIGFKEIHFLKFKR